MQKACVGCRGTIREIIPQQSAIAKATSDMVLCPGCFRYEANLVAQSFEQPRLLTLYETNMRTLKKNRKAVIRQ